MIENANTFFNVFPVDAFVGQTGTDVDYRERHYHKIMLIKGYGEFIYSDKKIPIDGYAIVFANPKINHTWNKRELLEQGYSCVFGVDFLSDIEALKYHLFKIGENFVIQLDEHQFSNFEILFQKMITEQESDYIYKYHFLKMLTYEVMHLALKIDERLIAKAIPKNGSERLYTNFLDLLEREFPIDDPMQTMKNRTPDDFAKNLFVHVNHLNRSVKKISKKTTSKIIKERIFREAKILLVQTNWNISQIANCLGYSEVTHFSKFFKKFQNATPTEFRNV